MRTLLLFLLTLLPAPPIGAQNPAAQPSMHRLVQQLGRSTGPLPVLPLKEAHRTLGQVRQRYQRGLPADTHLYLTARALNEAATPEPVLVLVDSWQGPRIIGRIVRAASPSLTTATAPVEFTEAEVLDWTLLHSSGAEEGNYLGKFLDLEDRLATLDE